MDGGVAITSMLIGALGWLASETQVLSHLARAMVDRSIKKNDGQGSTPLFVIRLEAKPEMDENPILEFFVSPVPSKFVLVSESGPPSLPVIGVILDQGSFARYPGMVAWFPLAWDSCNTLDLPSNTVGALFGTVNSNESRKLVLRHLDTFGTLEGQLVTTFR